jgi:predicted alpha/beta-hydrolase family hydrolase
MSLPDALPLTISVPEAGTVGALLMAPPGARACFVFAHGAGAGMAHAFMSAMASELAQRGVASLRYQFPYMERGSKRTDPPPLAHATVRAAVDEAHRRMPGVALFAGGKSFGGRMSSQAQASAPLDGVRGLAFVGFPLHPAGKPGIERAAHLSKLRCPMLFLQGTRDELADLALLRQVLAPLSERARLVVFEDADHSFHVRARSASSDAQVMAQMADAMAEFFASASG